MPDIINIIRAHLVEHGFDGLVCDASECGCELADLAPCREWIGDCQPAYRGADAADPADWAMYASKEAADRSKSNGNA